MAQLISVTGVKKGTVDNTGSYLICAGRIEDLQASGTDSIVIYRERRNKVVRWTFDETYASLNASRKNHDAGKSVTLTVIEKDGQTIDSVTQDINIDNIVYVYANPSNSNQSYVQFDDDSKKEPTKYLVSHTVAAILTLANAADDFVMDDITCSTISITPTSNVDAINVTGTNMTTASVLDANLVARTGSNTTAVVDINLGTSDIEATDRIIYVTEARDHDDAAGDNYRGIYLAMSSDWDGTNATSDVYLVGGEYSGTIGTGGANADVHVVRGDISTATITAGYASGITGYSTANAAYLGYQTSAVDYAALFSPNAVGAGVDVIIDPSGTTIVDIAPDVFQTGTLLNFAYDTAETLTGAVTYINIDGSTNITHGDNVVTGINIAVDYAEQNNPAYGIIISKDTTNSTAVGPLTTTNNALQITSVNATSAAATGTLNASDNLAEFSLTNSTAIATADVYAGNMLALTYGATTSGTGTATTTTGAMNIDYNLNESAGTLTVDDLNIINIDYDTSGTLTYADGNFNMININVTDAGVPVYGTCVFSGVNVDLSGMDVSDNTLNLAGVRITMPATYGVATEAAIHATGNGNTFDALLGDGIKLTMTEAASIACNIISDTTDADNSMRVFYGSRDISGAVTADRALDLFAATIYQNVVNSTTGDWDITDGAATSGCLSLVSAHTVSAGTAKTGADTFSGKGLNINIAATTGADANALLDFTARGIYIDYTLTDGGNSTLNYEAAVATGIIEVDWNVNAGTVLNNNAVVGSVLAGTVLDANGFVPGATLGAATVIAGYYIDMTSVDINDANASLYGYKVILPDDTDNTTNAINSGFISVLSTSSGISNVNDGFTAWDVHTNTAVGGTDTTTSRFGRFEAVYTANEATTGATITRQTNPVLDFDISMTATGALDTVTISSGFIDMTVTAGGGGGAEVIYGNMVNMTLAGTNNAAQTLRGYYIQGNGLTLNNAGANFIGLDIEFDSATLTSSGDVYGIRVISHASADGAIYGTDGTYSAILANGTNAVYTIGNYRIDGTGVTATHLFDLENIALTTGSLWDIGAITTKTSGYLYNGSMTTSTLDASTLLDDFSCSCDHDDLAGDTLRMIRRTWSGAVPGNNAADLALIDAIYSGTIGASGSSAVAYALRGDVASATLTAGVLGAGYFTDGTQLLTVCNRTSHLYSGTSVIIDMPVPAEGAGVSNAELITWVPYGKKGSSGMIVTELIIDITGLQNSGTLNDIIGNNDGTGCHFGQITAAIHGTLQAMTITCLEAPAGADADIDFAIGTVATGAENADVTGITGYASVHANGGNWTQGSVAVVDIADLPSANEYLYISDGGAAGGDNPYSAGRFLIRIYGS